MIQKIRAIWQLMRVEHGIMLGIAILVGSFIGGKSLPDIHIFMFAFFTALFLETSTFALNDYYDLDIDKKNMRKDRPLVRGELHPKTALYLFLVLFPLGILCSFFVNAMCFLIALVTGIFGVLYDVRIKKIKMLGNIYIAYIMAIPFIFGGAMTAKDFFPLDIPHVVYVLALMAFLSGLGREIMKDVMDFKGDQEGDVKSLPKYIGVYRSNIVSALLYTVAVSLSFLPFLVNTYSGYHHNLYYLSIIVVADMMFLFTSLQLVFNKDVDIRFHRRFTLAAIFIGLLAFLITAFTG